MLVYAVISAETETAVETFVRREDAERFLEEGRRRPGSSPSSVRLEAVELDA